MLAYVFFLGNFLYYTRLGVNGLTILWSLAVEEHFYLVFPLAVRYLSRAILCRLLIAVLLIEPILRFLATPHFSNFLFIYVWTCFRLDGLALGALLALLLEESGETATLARWSGPVALIGIGLVFALSTAFPTHFNRELNTPFFNAFGYSLVALSCAGILAYVILHPAALLSQILASAPAVWLGTISYGFYLFHQPVRLALSPHFGRTLVLLTFVTTTSVSWLSFTFYERPLSRWGHRRANRLGAKSAFVAEGIDLA